MLLARCEASSTQRVHRFRTNPGVGAGSCVRQTPSRRREAGAAVPDCRFLSGTVSNTADYPTTAGTPGLRDFRPADDAPIVKSLRTGGALVLDETEPARDFPAGGPVTTWRSARYCNPYDPTRIPGQQWRYSGSGRRRDGASRCSRGHGRLDSCTAAMCGISWRVPAEHWTLFDSRMCADLAAVRPGRATRQDRSRPRLVV